MINRLKVNIFDKNLIVQFKSVVSLLVGVLTTILIFKDIPQKYKNYCFIAFVILLIIIYLVLWVRSNTIKRVELNINNSKMEIEQGDIFEQDGLKVIAFNEFFDTEVSDRLISDKTLNGIYLKNIVSDVNKLDLDIENDQYLSKNIIEKNVQRAEGKSTRYELGSIYKRDDYLLTAFSKFDEYNRAYLTIKDYNNFLINFWKEIDKIYNAENISIPLLGSNITRFKECNLS
ncbi:MAG: macro domain-containing protein, partial [Romboutsia sp.]